MIVDSTSGGGSIGAMTTKTTAYSYSAYAQPAAAGPVGQGGVLQSSSNTSSIQADAEL
jgi:hypothetical protein